MSPTAIATHNIKTAAVARLNIIMLDLEKSSITIKPEEAAIIAPLEPASSIAMSIEAAEIKKNSFLIVGVLMMKGAHAVAGKATLSHNANRFELPNMEYTLRDETGELAPLAPPGRKSSP
jgi:hypothetical protein